MRRPVRLVEVVEDATRRARPCVARVRVCEGADVEVDELGVARGEVVRREAGGGVDESARDTPAVVVRCAGCSEPREGRGERPPRGFFGCAAAFCASSNF